MKTKRSFQNKNAFTLVELLVVLAIISILSALLLPSLKSAKAVANSAACISNLRQIYLAFALYAENNDDRIPNTYWVAPLGSGKYLGGLVADRDYSGATIMRYKVLKCPSEKRIADPFSVISYPSTFYENPTTFKSYAINWDFNRYNYSPPATTRKWSQDPTLGPNGTSPGSRSLTPFITDINNAGYDIPQFLYDLDDVPLLEAPTCPSSGHSFRHPGKRANMCYLDGHISGVKPKSQTGVSIWFYSWDPGPIGEPQ